jgi:hypothetical protein
MHPAMHPHALILSSIATAAGFFFNGIVPSVTM